jgi:hypothetical protein
MYILRQLVLLSSSISMGYLKQFQNVCWSFSIN